MIPGNITTAKVADKVSTTLRGALGTAKYKLNQLKHLPQMPHLTPIGQRIVEEVNAEGVSVVPLEALSFLSNGPLLSVWDRVVADLSGANTEAMEYAGGFQHCAPLNPTDIATKYPELYLWGLDEKLLDIVEACIGLPIAYHGVIARRESTDGQTVGTRLWHKDSEDVNIIRVSVYLTDVLDDQSGPFEYIPKPLTPSYRRFRGVTKISDTEMARVVPRERWQQCIGPRGTVIFGAVAKVLHHGKLPKQPRQAASYYYTSRTPVREELCRKYSFQRGVPLIKASLTERQKDCLWKYRSLLPSAEQISSAE